MRLLVSENFVAKRAALTILELHTKIISSIEHREDSWKVGPGIMLSNPIYLEVENLPVKVRSNILKSYSSSMQEFRSTDLPFTSTKDCFLRLKLKWKYDEDSTDTFLKSLSNYCRNQDELIGLQKKLDMFQFFGDLTDRGEYTAKEIYQALLDIDLLYYKNYVSFSVKFKKYKTKGAAVFLNKNRNKEKPWKQKVTAEHKAKVLQEYGNNKDTLQITETLKDYSEQHQLAYISRSTIKKIINTPTVRVVQGLERNGAAYIKNNVLSYIEKEKPKFKFQVIECDGSRLQLPYRKTDNSKWKIGYLTLYIIMDVASNKVLGYWIDDFENKEMVFMAFFMMLVKHKYLPAFIRIDRSSAHQSNRFKEFLSLAHKFGMSHKVCFEPREKGTIENFFHWFPEKICKKYPIYTGLGPMVKSWDKKPSPEKTKSIEQSKKLPVKSELKFSIPKLIEEWNERPNCTDLRFPNRIHNELNIDSATLISEEQIARLTWSFKEKKRFTRNTISFQDKSRERRSYSLKEFNNIAENFEQPLHIYWLQSEPEFIFVFTTNGTFIEKAKMKNRYLDDPINISDPEHNNLIKEKNENYGMIKTIKEKVKISNQKLIDDAKTQTPFSITSGLQSDKENIKEVVDDFFLAHNSHEVEKEKAESKLKSSVLEKNIVKTKVKTKYKYSPKYIINDVE